jgi:hypothetical protein
LSTSRAADVDAHNRPHLDRVLQSLLNLKF